MKTNAPKKIFLEVELSLETLQKMEHFKVNLKQARPIMAKASLSGLEDFLKAMQGFIPPAPASIQVAPLAEKKPLTPEEINVQKKYFPLARAVTT